MSWPISPGMPSLAECRQSWIDKHYLEKGRVYTYEIECRREWGKIIPKWQLEIREAEAPWGIVCIENFRTKWTAELWARAYLKRGGPPEGYFTPRVDKNATLYA